MYPRYTVRVFRMERYLGPHGVMTLSAEIGLLIYTIYFSVKEIRELKRYRKQYLKVREKCPNEPIFCRISWL